MTIQALSLCDQKREIVVSLRADVISILNDIDKVQVGFTVYKGSFHPYIINQLE